MLAEIADRANAESRGFFAAHDERVGVVEAERLSDPDAELCERISNLLDRQRFVRLQNFLADRAGIFGIATDLPAAQRFPKNDRAAHSLSMFRGNAGVLERAFRDFSENI